MENGASGLKRTMSIGKEFSFKLIFVAVAALMVFPHLTYAVGRGSWMTGLKDLGGAETFRRLQYCKVGI